MNFIERNTKKVAIIIGLATAVSAVTTVYAAENSDGWHGNGATRVYKEDGQAKVNTLLYLPDGTYYLDAKGNPITSQWKEVKGKVFYFDVNGKKVNGKQVINGHEYTFQQSGALLTGWNDAKDTYYDKFGNEVTGVQTIENKTYNFDDNGKVKSGWSTVNGKKVYFNKDGSLANGVTTVDGKKYNFNADGTVTKGWTKSKGEKFYYNDYGFMTKGWKTIDGKKYYFDKKGQAVADTEYAGYKFDKDGVAKEIKEKDDDKSDSKTTTKSNSTSKKSVKSSSVANLPSAKGSVASAALSQLGVIQDCTALVSNALAANGIYFHGWPADYMSLGNITNNPQPGDLIYYANGGMGAAHIAVYIGNGQAVHGGWLGNQTVETSAYVGSGPVFIRLK